jgi:hypothetical protein
LALNKPFIGYLISKQNNDEGTKEKTMALKNKTKQTKELGPKTA